MRRNLGILRRLCPHIRRAVREVGYPEPRSRQAGFGTLIRIVIDQQVSTAAGAAIWAKLAKACGGRVTPARLTALGETGLRASGFSLQKAGYALGIAAAVQSKRLSFAKLHGRDDTAVRETLTALKGIGAWSADIYLMFAMGRPDVWPVADLALQHGVRMLHGLADRPTVKEMELIGEIWRPYRSGAALLLWRYYGAMVRKNKG